MVGILVRTFTYLFVYLLIYFETKSHYIMQVALIFGSLLASAF